MANAKITKKEVVTMMLADERIISNADYKAYLENELKLLTKKADSKKPSKVQVANEGLKATLVEVLVAQAKPVTVSELIKADTRLADFSNQKISALCSSLKKSNLVDKVEDKRKSYYKAI